MVPSERLKPRSECQSQAQLRSTGRFSNASQGSSIFTYSIPPFLANSGLYTTPSLPLLLTLLFTGNPIGTCGSCCDRKVARAAVIHLLLNAWTVGLAEDGFFRPPEGPEPREEHCLPLGNLATVACDFWWKWPIRINPSHRERSRERKKKKNRFPSKNGKEKTRREETKIFRMAKYLEWHKKWYA